MLTSENEKKDNENGDENAEDKKNSLTASEADIDIQKETSVEDANKVDVEEEQTDELVINEEEIKIKPVENFSDDIEKQDTKEDVPVKEELEKISQEKLNEILASVAEEEMSKIPDAPQNEVSREFKDTDEMPIEGVSNESDNKEKQPLQMNEGFYVLKESFGYACQVCGAETTLNADICTNCGAEFALVKCDFCGFIGEKNDFKNHRCPQCYIEPVELPAKIPEEMKCSSCGRPLRDGYFYCHLCGSIDWGAMLWFFGIVVLVLIIIPMFGSIIGGFFGHTLYYLGIIFGGLLFFNFGRTLLTAWSKPKRITFYWFITIVMLLLISM